MTQRKADGEHTSGRRKSENRQRNQFVGVRFNDAEYAALTDAMTTTGKRPSTLLRETFLKAHKRGAL
jgi:hypothetical protein